MGEQSRTRLEGDRYQHLYSWLLMLDLLDEQKHLAYVWVEHPTAGALDDVTVHPLDPTTQPTRYYQVKWHVDHTGAYSIESLMTHDPGSTSLLMKCWRSWNALHQQSVGPIEIWLVSNWGFQPGDVLGTLVHGRDWRLDDAALTVGPKSNVGKAVRRWKAHLTADPLLFTSFFRALRFRLGFASITDLEHWVDDRMAAVGLKPGAESRRIAIDQIREWIELGGEQKRITRHHLEALLTQHQLWDQVQPRRSLAEQAVLRARYVERLQQETQHVRLKGIASPGAAIPIEAIYTTLKVLRQRPDYEAITHTEDPVLSPLSTDEDVTDRRAARQRVTPSLIHEAVAEHPALVLLGHPGAGKTTFLRYLAHQAAQSAQGPFEHAGNHPMPILVALAAYAKVAEHQRCSLATFITTDHLRTYDLPQGASLLHDALSAGTALVLLDGLDEITDDRARLHVSDAVEEFIHRYGPIGNQIIVTSRVVGYKTAAIDLDLPHYTILDFDQAAMTTFVYAWYRATTPTEAHHTASVGSDPAIQHLLTGIMRNPSIMRFAQNPLMLTILVSLYQQGQPLPRRRIQLYDRYITTLIDLWNGIRSTSRQAPAPTRESLDMIRVLAPLGLWLHQHTAHGMARAAILEREIQQIMRDLRDADPERAAHHWFRDIRTQSNLIIEYGPDAWGFLHLTFEEYFAARAIVMQPTSARFAFLAPYLHQPRWREVILLVAGQIGRMAAQEADATQLVHAIAHAGSVLEDVLHRDLFLACAIIAEDCGIHHDTALPLVQQMARLWWHEVELLRPTRGWSYGPDTLREQVVQHIRLLVGTPFLDDALAIIRPALDDASEYARGDALRVFGQARQWDVIRGHLEDSAWAVRTTAAEILCEAQQWDIAPLLTSENAKIRISERVVYALEAGDQWDTLEALLETGLDDHVLEVLIRALAGGSEWQRLLGFIHEDNWESHDIVYALGQSGHLENVRHYLTSDDADLREAVAWCLAEQGLWQELAPCLNDPDPEVCRAVIYAYGQAGQWKEVLPFLVHTQAQARAAAVQALGESEHWVDIQQALHDEDHYVRQCAVTVLGNHEEWNAVRQALHDPDMQVRHAALSLLGQSSFAHELADQLDHPDIHHRIAALQALAGAGHWEAVARGLTDSEPQVRSRAAQALAKAGQWTHTLSMSGDIPEAAQGALIESLAAAHQWDQVQMALQHADATMRRAAATAVRHHPHPSLALLTELQALERVWEPSARIEP